MLYSLLKGVHSMEFNGFTKKDFDILTIEGLEPRMSELKKNISTKFDAIGQQLSPFLSIMTKEEMYYHVAKHARRTKNPPDVTWVAWSSNKRGYKAYPHFQVGLWPSHLFIMFAIIYEASNKQGFAAKLNKRINSIYKEIPEHFVWSLDHTAPDVLQHKTLDKEALHNIFTRLEKVKKAELLCGITIDKNDPILQDDHKLITTIEATFKKLLPLYQLAQAE